MIRIPEEIINALPQKKLVFFIGAGFSKPLGFIDWHDLALVAIEKYLTSFPDVKLLKEAFNKNLLSEILVFDALKDLDKHKIIETIKAKNNIQIDETKLDNHRRIWKISEKIITTNYDKALETVKPCTSIEVISHNHLFEIGKSLKKETWLFHIHGMIDNVYECIIFSENYHKLYSEKHPAIEQLKSIALNNTILFLGFSMKDKYVAKLFEDLNLIFSDTPSSEHFVLLEESESINSKYIKKIPIDSYSNISSFLDSLISLKEELLQSHFQIKSRYLRRRCRTFALGSTEFNSIMIELRNEEFTKNNVIKLENRISHLSGYEKILATAALFENSGEIEKMIHILDDAHFQGNKESTRLLYLAIGFEKLDKIRSAIQTLDLVTNNPDSDSEISLCAKFNRCICNEKLENYDEVYFETLIKDTTVLRFSKERIKDKAISNHLIVCKKRRMPFNYENELNESIEYEITNSAKSQSKTLVNYLMYKNEFITKDKYEEIIRLGKNMTANSRVTLLISLYKQMDIETMKLLKEEIFNKVEALCTESNSHANRKHLEELKEFINAQNFS